MKERKTSTYLNRPSRQHHRLSSVPLPPLLFPAEPDADVSRTILARGSRVANFPDRLAFFLVLPALGATSGACASTVATVEVVFWMVSGLRSKSGEGLSPLVAECRIRSL